VLEREGEAVDLDPVAALDEPLRLLPVPLGVRPAREPPAVLAPLGRPQGGVREDVLRAQLLPPAERLEDCAAREFVLAIAEQRPVRNLARRRASGADGVEQPARPLRGEPVEGRSRGRLVPGPPAESVVGPVCEPVEGEDDDGIHAARRLSRAACTWIYLRRYETVRL